MYSVYLLTYENSLITTILNCIKHLGFEILICRLYIHVRIASKLLDVAK